MFYVTQHHQLEVGVILTLCWHPTFFVIISDIICSFHPLFMTLEHVVVNIRAMLGSLTV